MEEDPADVVLGEVDVAAVERGQAVDQVDVQLHRVEVVQQLKQNPGLNKLVELSSLVPQGVVLENLTYFRKGDNLRIIFLRKHFSLNKGKINICIGQFPP